MTNIVLFFLLMIPATFFLGVYDTLERKILKSGMREGELVGVSYIGSSILLILFLFFFGLPEIKTGFWYALGISASLNSISQFIWAHAFSREEASLISPFRLVTPPLVLLTGFFVLGEAPSFLGAAGVLITIGGLWLFLHSEAVFNHSSFRAVIARPGVLLGLLGAVLFAISFPYDKKAILASSTLLYMAAMYGIVGLVNFGAHYFLNGGKVSFLRKDIGFLIAVQALGGFLAFHALHYSLAAYAASVKRLGSLWAVILSGHFLDEHNIGKKLFAAGIMLSGIAVTALFG